jgi:hypothetical protein
MHFNNLETKKKLLEVLSNKPIEYYNDELLKIQSELEQKQTLYEIRRLTTILFSSDNFIQQPISCPICNNILLKESKENILLENKELSNNENLIKEIKRLKDIIEQAEKLQSTLIEQEIDLQASNNFLEEQKQFSDIRIRK